MTVSTSQEYHEIFKEPAVHLGLMSPRNLRSKHQKQEYHTSVK